MKSIFKFSSSSSKLSGWGVFWRCAGMAVLLIAVVASLILGLQYGAAYIAGLGVSELATTAMSILLTAFVYGGIGVTTMYAVGRFENLFGRKSTATAAPAAMAADSAPAAA